MSVTSMIPLVVFGLGFVISFFMAIVIKLMLASISKFTNSGSQNS